MHQIRFRLSYTMAGRLAIGLVELNVICPVQCAFIVLRVLFSSSLNKMMNDNDDNDDDGDGDGDACFAII